MVRILGPLNPKILKTAIKRVVYRHEILRTTFHCLPEMIFPVQVIAESDIIRLDNYDLSSLTTAEQETKIKALLHESSRWVLDLETPPLMHLSLVTLKEDNHQLLISLPSLCADTTGLVNLVVEISRSYAACVQDEPSYNEPTQYADLSEFLNNLLESEDSATGREYWQKQERAALATWELPFENQLSDESGFAPQLLIKMVPPEMVTRIQELAEIYQIRPAVWLLASFMILLWRLTSREDLIIGTAHDGRTYEELEAALGVFAKYLPLHCHFIGDSQFSDILVQLNESIHEGSQWQEYFSWEHLHQSIDNEIEIPFFPVCFDFEPQPRTMSRWRDRIFDFTTIHLCGSLPY